MNRLSALKVIILVILAVIAGVVIYLINFSSDDNSNTENKANTTSESLGNFAAPPGATAQPLGEVGPGACWPENSFANREGATQAGTWYKTTDPKVASAAERDVAWVDAHADYYLPREVVPDWDQLPTAQDKMAAYTAKLVFRQLKSPMLVQNTYCDEQTGQVTLWLTQVFPAGEWMAFIPGHEPDSKNVRPARKVVCGNWVLPVVKAPEATPPGTTTTGAPPPHTPPTTYTPPPPTTKTLTPKVPSQAPGGGTGTDRQTAGPPAPPAVPKPTHTGPAQAPAPPPANPVPGGNPAPAPTQPLPVEPGGGSPSQPSDGCVPSPTDPCS